MQETVCLTPCRIIGVAGGSGSGKTTFCRLLQNQLHPGSCSILSQDHYYIDQSAKFRGDGENVNFDHPDALDFALMATHLGDLREGKAIQVPRYDFVTHQRKSETTHFPAMPYVVLDGILILSQPKILALLDVSVFIETPEETRLTRRVHRDQVERGRTREGILKQFTHQVKPMHDAFVEPSKASADYLISGADPFEKHIRDWAIKLMGT